MIQVNNLIKTFDGFKALDGVNMNVKRGSVYGLVGPNGAGKSTLIRHITGVMRPDAGEVFVDGENVYENSSVKSKMAYIPDDMFYFVQSDTIEMMKYYKGMYRNFDEKMFYRLQEFFPAIDVKRNIRKLSKGMQKQAYFILAVSTMPEILILDEPIDGLDPIVRKRVWSIIVDEVADRQMTVLVSSHNLREMEGVCDAIGIMKNGRVQIERDIDTLKTDIHKVQVAFTSEVYDPFKGLNVIHEDSRGSVKLIIAKNSFEEIEDIIGRNNPAVFDVLPLTLEEIFIYELGGGKDEQIFV